MRSTNLAVFWVLACALAGCSGIAMSPEFKETCLRIAEEDMKAFSESVKKRAQFDPYKGTIHFSDEATQSLGDDYSSMLVRLQEKLQELSAQQGELEITVTRLEYPDNPLSDEQWVGAVRAKCGLNDTYARTCVDMMLHQKRPHAKHMTNPTHGEWCAFDGGPARPRDDFVGYVKPVIVCVSATVAPIGHVLRRFDVAIEGVDPRSAFRRKSQPAAGDSKHRTPVERIKALKDLLDAGAITQDEFDAKRAKILDEL